MQENQFGSITPPGELTPPPDPVAVRGTGSISEEIERLVDLAGGAEKSENGKSETGKRGTT